jgi:hypothetical protein
MEVVVQSLLYPLLSLPSSISPPKAADPPPIPHLSVEDVVAEEAVHPHDGQDLGREQGGA